MTVNNETTMVSKTISGGVNIVQQDSMFPLKTSIDSTTNGGLIAQKKSSRALMLDSRVNPHISTE
jgi:hypothetical protein